MSTAITFPKPDGATYFIPDVDDEDWGQNVTDFLVAIPLGVPPRSGTFALTGDLSFGTSFGLISKYFTSGAANPANAGVVRLSNTDLIEWRNHLNSGNVTLGVNTSDVLTFNGTPINSGTGTVGNGTAGNLTLYPTTSAIVGDTYVQNTKNIVVAIAAQGSRSQNLTYTIPNPGNAATTATFALLESAQTFTGSKTFSTGITFNAGAVEIFKDFSSTGDIRLEGTGTGFWTGEVYNSSRFGTLLESFADVGIGGSIPAASLTVQGADITSTGIVTTFYKSLWRISVYHLVTTADAGAGTATVTLGWHDDNKAQTLALSAINLTSAGAFTQASTIVENASAQVITYAVAHTGSYATAKYSLYITAERLM